MVVCVTYCMAGDDDGAGVETIESARMLTMKFKIMVCVTYCMAGLALLAMCMSLIQEGLMIKVLFLDSIFIGPKSDHWQPLSRTHSLTNSLDCSLLFSRLDRCDLGV